MVTGAESTFGADITGHASEATAGRLMQGLLTHELTHALQDQHFDLAKLSVGNRLSDADAARKALVEGDASLVMVADLANLMPDEIPVMSVWLRKLLEDPKQFMAMTRGAPGMAELDAAPPWIRDTLLFSYLQGASFCAALLEHGGQRLLDHAFTSDPPRSTEQILHPEKWYGGRDDPVVIAWPEFGTELPGYSRAAAGQLGELGIRILLREGLNDARRAAATAAGWGGDRFAVYRRHASGRAARKGAPGPGRGLGAASDGDRESPDTLLAWIVEWDDEAAAGRFAGAMTALGAGWTVERTAARRVVVLRGAASAALRTSLLAKLAAAPAEAPANRLVDPAAIDPQKKIGAVGSILADRREKRHKQLQNQTDLVGQLSEDQRTYSVPALGLSLRLPEAMVGWQHQQRPKPILMARMGPQQMSLQVMAIDMHRSASIDFIEPIFEAGMDKMMPGFTKLDGHPVDLAGQRGYDLIFHGTRAGVASHGVLRIFVQGTWVVGIMLTSLEDRWADNEALAAEALSGITMKPAPAIYPAAMGSGAAAGPAAAPPPAPQSAPTEPPPPSAAAPAAAPPAWPPEVSTSRDRPQAQGFSR